MDGQLRVALRCYLKLTKRLGSHCRPWFLLNAVRRLALRLPDTCRQTLSDRADAILETASALDRRDLDAAAPAPPSEFCPDPQAVSLTTPSQIPRPHELATIPISQRQVGKGCARLHLTCTRRWWMLA